MYVQTDVSYDDEDGDSLNIKHFPANETQYPLFQSNVAAEFPTDLNATSRIPHIIHQIWSNENVPSIFEKPMRSFVSNNPTWEYRFWTYSSGRNFLLKYHSYLVDIYDKFDSNDVKKSDLLRMAIIYEYGGVYVDLDMKNLRPLNITTVKYACILPTEPFEHSTLIYDEEVIMSTAVLLCRPKHPFIKDVLLSMRNVDPKGNPVEATGPYHVTQIYLKYNNIIKTNLHKHFDNTDIKQNSPYFYKGTRDVESDDGIYIPNSQYFMDEIDPMLRNEDGNIKKCVDKSLNALSFLEKRGCTEYESRKLIRNQRRYTFMIHYWYHFWTLTEDYAKNMRRVHIKQIIPKAVLLYA